MARIKPELIWTDESTASGADPYWLYCIAEDRAEATGPCKVGIATNITKRLSSLQGGNWRILNLMWTVRVAERDLAKYVEEWCLQAFRPSIYTVDGKQRLSSEWVDATPAKVLEKALWVLDGRGETVRRLA